MQIVKVLSRKDAYSVLLAIVLAMAIQSVMTVTYYWANSLLNGSGNEFGGPANAWDTIYWPSIVSALIQFVAIEVFLWIVVLLKQVSRPVRAKK